MYLKTSDPHVNVAFGGFPDFFVYSPIILAKTAITPSIWAFTCCLLSNALTFLLFVGVIACFSLYAQNDLFSARKRSHQQKNWAFKTAFVLNAHSSLLYMSDSPAP